MADSEMSTHKRSKSSRVLAHLHREKTRDGDAKSSLAPDASEAGSSTLSLSSQTAGTSTFTSSKQAQSVPTSGISPAKGKQTVTTSSAEDKDVSTGQSVDKTVSIEQSILMFKLLEILRSGDTDEILKKVDETYLSNKTSIPGSSGSLEGTTLLHLATQVADIPTVETIINTVTQSQKFDVDLNARDRDGNTVLHVASMLGRAPIVKLLLTFSTVNDSIVNYQGKMPLDLARTPDIFQQLQLSRSLFLESKASEIQSLISAGKYETFEQLLEEPRVKSVLDINGGDLVSDPMTLQTGGTLLHEAARRKDSRLIQILLLHGADPFRRDRKGKLPQEVTKDDKTKAMLKKSPAAAAAQRGIQEKAVLGNNQSQATLAGAGAGPDSALAGKDGRELKGYLKKWTNYTSGYKLRWFVLEDGVLSYYKHQDDAGSACRGAINMRIAKLWMDPQDKQRFEILGKSSVKYHLKANHDVEAKRWYWALNNAIQWAKDEAREEEKKKFRTNETLKQARLDQAEQGASKEKDTGENTLDNLSVYSGHHGSKSGRGQIPASSVPVSVPRVAFSKTSGTDSIMGDEDGVLDTNGELTRIASQTGTATIEGDVDDDEEYGDDASSQEVRPASKDAFNITANSARLQLDLLAQVTAALQVERSRVPAITVADPTVEQAIMSYETAVRSLKRLISDLLKISRDRDAYWQYRLDREVDVRKIWEENMAKLIKEHEALEGRIGESEVKRRKTKKALREVLENTGIDSKRSSTSIDRNDAKKLANVTSIAHGPEFPPTSHKNSFGAPARRKSTIAEMTNLSDSDSDDDDEFFDAVGAGEIEVTEEMPTSAKSPDLSGREPIGGNDREAKKRKIATAFTGYEDPIRKKLSMDADDRPKISLWGILKSMIGKDMTKMTLPVSFNEPTSLLQRVAEDMEYTDLLDIAADRPDPTERMVYVAAFAASEYASTIGRVAKPFNPLLGETYEYVRPDKGYRFFIEQVSHHPPIGAAYAESPKWDYYGESAVKSKFYGKSFDINPLGTWFLRLRPVTGKDELYTWKKVTSSVVGIITGSPTVDNYGPMDITNHTTGEVCNLEFKQRGWRAAGAFEVKGKVLDASGKQRWSIGGHWNDKLYARLTPGFDAPVIGPSKAGAADPAVLVWEAHGRPTGIPFNLTPFVLTLNAIPDGLRKYVAPTDTRLRPDQRAMEDGEYDFAAEEKNRVEEKQRATRRRREEAGEEFVPHWFHKGKCETTGEDYWVFNGKYWKVREDVQKGGKWDVEDIF